jgi:hypothetical protein
MRRRGVMCCGGKNNARRTRGGWSMPCIRLGPAARCLRTSTWEACSRDSRVDRINERSDPSRRTPACDERDVLLY